MGTTKDRPATTGRTLRQIVEDRQQLDAWLLEQDGELTPELDSLLRDQEADEKKKIEAVGFYIATEEEEIEALKRTIDRLTARRKAKENRIDWLKNRYLAEMLLKLGYKVGDAVKGALATVRIQLNNPRLDGVPEDQAVLELWSARGVEWVHEKVEYVFDKKAALEAGKLDPKYLPEGVTIVRDESVRVA